MDVTRRTDLLREAEEHHGRYEPSSPPQHGSGWYPAHLGAGEQGRDTGRAAVDATAHVEGAGR